MSNRNGKGLMVDSDCSVSSDHERLIVYGWHGKSCQPDGKDHTDIECKSGICNCLEKVKRAHAMGMKSTDTSTHHCTSENLNIFELLANCCWPFVVQKS